MSHHSLRELASSACVGSSSFPASTSYSSSSSSFDLFIPSAKENSATTTTGAAAVAAAGKTIGVSPAIKAVSGSFGGIIEVGLVVLSSWSSREELLFVNDDTISKMEKKRRRVNSFCSLSMYLALGVSLFTTHLRFFLSFINNVCVILKQACCLQPVDVVKTRLQLDKTGQYKGIADCFKQIQANEGTKALWKGLTPFATHLCFKYMLRMGTNATFQAGLRDENGYLSTQRRMLAGFGAGVCEAVMIVTPFEVVKIRLQQQKGLDASKLKYKGTFHCAKTIIAEEGVKGLWSGVGPTIARNGTNQMCLFTAKAQVDKTLWGKHDGDGMVLHPAQSLVSGGLAATFGPIATGPFDVMKTRLMAQAKAPPGTEAKYKGFLHAGVVIFREEGIFAMWKGLLPRLMRIPPGQAITWMVADQVVGFVERRQEEQ